MHLFHLTHHLSYNSRVKTKNFSFGGNLHTKWISKLSNTFRHEKLCNVKRFRTQHHVARHSPRWYPIGRYYIPSENRFGLQVNNLCLLSVSRQPKQLHKNTNVTLSTLLSTLLTVLYSISSLNLWTSNGKITFLLSLFLSIEIIELAILLSRKSFSSSHAWRSTFILVFPFSLNVRSFSLFSQAADFSLNFGGAYLSFSFLGNRKTNFLIFEFSGEFFRRKFLLFDFLYSRVTNFNFRPLLSLIETRHVLPSTHRSIRQGRKGQEGRLRGSVHKAELQAKMVFPQGWNLPFIEV